MRIRVRVRVWVRARVRVRDRVRVRVRVTGASFRSSTTIGTSSSLSPYAARKSACA